LRRRAAFLSTALAAFGGCSRSAPPADEPAGASRTEVVVPEAESDAGTINEAVPEPEQRPKPVLAPPSLETPPGVSETARERFDGLGKQMREIYALLDSLDVPQKCDIASASCDARWRKLASDLVTLDDRARWISSPCRGSSKDAKLYAEREKEHVDYLALRRKQLMAEIDEALASGGALAQKRWKEHQREARLNRPQVCLSYGCVDW
jgi:hypothetical protein